ncbi:hypothetical protein C0991_010070 [Blastosporella zonata]|nr:hypothetical protein C0991_010070 [Blastosporella zonata]
MAPSTTSKAAAEKPARKTKSGGGGKKKLTAFNKFMQSEMARLREEEPETSHKDRFKMATANWKNAKENPNRAS